MKKRLFGILAVVGLVATGVFASTASAAWNNLTFNRDGTGYAAPGVYYDTPESVAIRQYGGPCSNIRYQIRRVADGVVVRDAPPLSFCPGWTAGVWFAPTFPNQSPNYGGGVRIYLIAGPADFALVGASVNGCQGFTTACGNP